MPSLVEIGPVVLVKKIFKLSMYFSNFIIISPWKKVGPLQFSKLESHSQIKIFVPSLVEIGPVVLEKKMKM